MIKLFTRKYSTFEEWLADHPRDTVYKQRIVRQRELHPEASLSQLRGHVKIARQKIGRDRRVIK